MLAGKNFLELSEAELAAYASEAGAWMPPAYLASVTENLRVLQHHARLVAAALKERGVDPAATVETVKP